MKQKEKCFGLDHKSSIQTTKDRIHFSNLYGLLLHTSPHNGLYVKEQKLLVSKI